MNLSMMAEKNRSTNSVYVQQSADKKMMTISFEYVFNGKIKSFNLYRRSDESLFDSLERLKLNLQKIMRIKKPKIDPPIECPNVEVGLKVEDSLLDPANTKNFEAWVEGAEMIVNGTSYSVRRDVPQVVFMKLPSPLMKDFMIVPVVDLANCSMHGCSFSWYRQLSAAEHEELTSNDAVICDMISHVEQSYWLKLCTGITYSPTEADVAHHIKVICQPSDGVKIGPHYSCVSSRPVELGPPNCPFEKRNSFTKELIDGSKGFRIVTYNILADLYADQEYSRSVLFAHCPTHALDIDYRRQLLLKEIHNYNADIICLQEVDKKEFIRTYKPFFELVSRYQGIFNTKGGLVSEGVATFFCRDRFDLIDTHRTILSDVIDPINTSIVHARYDEDMNEKSILTEGDDSDQIDRDRHPILNDLKSSEAKDLLKHMSPIREKIRSSQPLFDRFMARHTILQTNLLRSKILENKFILVANTHLYFHPDADHIRLLQGSVCVKYLEYLEKYYRDMIKSKFGLSSFDISLIFCGDMNSSPDCGLFKLLVDGKIDSNIPDWRSNEEEAVEGIPLETYLKFSSAYLDIPYTNFTPGFNGCLDYIYYDSRGLECKKVVPLPDHEDVIVSGGIPSDVFPSDHLALIAELEYKD